MRVSDRDADSNPARFETASRYGARRRARRRTRAHHTPHRSTARGKPSATRSAPPRDRERLAAATPADVGAARPTAPVLGAIRRDIARAIRPAPTRPAGRTSESRSRGWLVQRYQQRIAADAEDGAVARPRVVAHRVQH